MVGRLSRDAQHAGGTAGPHRSLAQVVEEVLGREKPGAGEGEEQPPRLECLESQRVEVDRLGARTPKLARRGRELRRVENDQIGAGPGAQRVEGIGVLEGHVQTIEPAVFARDRDCLLVEIHAANALGPAARRRQRETTCVAAQIEDMATARQLRHLPARLALVDEKSGLVAAAALDAEP